MTFIPFLIAIAWGVFASVDPRRATLWFPLLLPAYVLRTTIGPLPTTALELALAGLAIGFTYRHGWDGWREGLRRTKPWHAVAILWTLATIVAVFVAPDRIGALGLWRAYVLEPFVYFVLLASMMKTRDDRRVLVTTFIALAVVLALWAAFQFLTNIGIPYPWNTVLEKRRATGPFPFPNALSLISAPIAALCIGLALRTDGSRIMNPWLLWLGVASATIATILAKSVGGSLAILAALFIALLWNARTRWPAILTAILALLVVWFTPALSGPVTSTLTFNEWSGKVRLVIWKETWTMLKDHPVLGAGFGAYPDVIRPYHAATYIEIFQYPHNILLNVWSETGLPGVAVFTLICITWFKRTRERRWTALPLVAMLVHGLVDVPYFKNDLAILFWTLAALTIPLTDPAPSATLGRNRGPQTPFGERRRRAEREPKPMV